MFLFKCKLAEVKKKKIKINLDKKCALILVLKLYIYEMLISFYYLVVNKLRKFISNYPHIQHFSRICKSFE